MSKTTQANQPASPRKKDRAVPVPEACPSWRGRVNRSLARFDVAGHLAHRLEPHFKTWWVPVSLLAFPALLLILAFVIASLR